MIEQIARLPIAYGEIIGTDKGNEIARQRIGGQHDRNLGVVELPERFDHRDVVDRDKDDGIGAVLQHLLDHRFLFVDIVGLHRNEMDDSGACCLSDLVGGETERAIRGIGRVLGEHGYRHDAVGCAGRVRKQGHRSQ